MRLLDRARKLMRGLAPAPPEGPQAYDVACPLGHRLRGHRTEGYQMLPCPSCGEAVFILPRSPLPDPPIPSAPKRPKPARVAMAAPEDELPATAELLASPGDRDVEVDAEIEWDDAPSEVAPVEVPPATGLPDGPGDGGEGPERRTGTARRKSSRARPTTAEPGPAPEAAPARPVGEHLVDWARRHRHPLLFLAVALLVVGTVGYRVRLARRQDLPRIIELGRTQGLAALDEGRFDTAHQLLSEAKRAVDALGGAYEGAAEVRQGADEAAIIAGLCPQPLETLLAEAGRSDPSAWASRFDTLYKGRSILVDALVISAPDEASGRPRHELDYRVVQDGEAERPPRVGQVDTSDLRIFELARPKVGARVQFGARLASFAFDKASETWLIGLEPDSGVWITHPKALEALGWPVLDAPATEPPP